MGAVGAVAVATGCPVAVAWTGVPVTGTGVSLTGPGVSAVISAVLDTATVGNTPTAGDCVGPNVAPGTGGAVTGVGVEVCAWDGEEGSGVALPAGD